MIGGKWKPVILFHLTFGKKRNNELMKLIPSITQKMLTQHLRELEDEGVISRIVYNEVPPKVEYELTEYGWTLKEILYMMCRWGDTHIEQKYDGKATVLQNPELEAAQ
ncbi:winged helix-turn-helix transcriptional regulator [Paenibacillus albilobatus]|uniref:winged helix-turn-helix transcriptional regulator n=1 Tax=Paenibacillus albilobatus TaxID=2716884 RepID=UPI001BB34A2F|nr:helix-turn-helix domain-containing protein [Paenibacillus albilobatus]